MPCIVPVDPVNPAGCDVLQSTVGLPNQDTNLRPQLGGVVKGLLSNNVETPQGFSQPTSSTNRRRLLSIAVDGRVLLHTRVSVGSLALVTTISKATAAWCVPKLSRGD